MRRYRDRTPAQAALIGPPGPGRLDFDLLLPQLAGAPTRLDIGAGHGEFLAALAQAHPSERCLGVEIDRLRVTKIAHKCRVAGATNVRVFEDDAHRFVRTRVPPASLSRLYVLFPDPWPKRQHRRRRLLSRSFLIDCTHAAAPGARLLIASDCQEYALQGLSQLSTIPGCWRNLAAPSGYRIDPPTRYPTLFQRHTAAAGRPALHLVLERTAASAPPRVGWAGDAEPDGVEGYTRSRGDSGDRERSSPL